MNLKTPEELPIINKKFGKGLIEQKKTKPQKTLEFKLTQSMDTF